MSDGNPPTITKAELVEILEDTVTSTNWAQQITGTLLLIAYFYVVLASPK